MYIARIIIMLFAAFGFFYIAKKIRIKPGVLRVLIWFVLLLITIFITTIIMQAITGGTLVR